MTSVVPSPPRIKGSVIAGVRCVPCPATGLAYIAAAFNGGNPSDPFIGPPDPDTLDTCVTINLDQRLYYLQDEQQSVYALVNAEGDVKEGYIYDPYGKAIPRVRPLPERAWPGRPPSSDEPRAQAKP